VEYFFGGLQAKLLQNTGKSAIIARLSETLDHTRFLEKFMAHWNRRDVPPDVERIGNPLYAEHQIYWSTTATLREPNLFLFEISRRSR
jgi:hypothetical protein